MWLRIVASVMLGGHCCVCVSGMRDKCSQGMKDLRSCDNTIRDIPPAPWRCSRDHQAGEDRYVRPRRQAPSWHEAYGWRSAESCYLHCLPGH